MTGMPTTCSISRSRNRTGDHEAFLIFDGVVYSADVYLNGHHVARHDWGYSPFHCRVTDYLRDTNRLFVLVDNKLSKDRVPGVRFDWNNDGGIINGVKLVFVPSTYIRNFKTSTRMIPPPVTRSSPHRCSWNRAIQPGLNPSHSPFLT